MYRNVQPYIYCCACTVAYCGFAASRASSHAYDEGVPVLTKGRAGGDSASRLRLTAPVCVCGCGYVCVCVCVLCVVYACVGCKLHKLAIVLDCLLLGAKTVHRLDHAVLLKFFRIRVICRSRRVHRDLHASLARAAGLRQAETSQHIVSLYKVK
jgi:hypothetical protein